MIKKYKNKESGQSLVEYILILALVAIAAILAIRRLTTDTSSVTNAAAKQGTKLDRVSLVSAKNIDGESNSLFYCFSDDGKTLYITGDSSKVIDGYEERDMTENIKSGWCMSPLAAGVTKVVIEDIIYPTSCANLFDGMSSLVEVEGQNKLRMDQCTNTSYMFQNCSSLKTIDLSGMTSLSITDSRYMFAQCTELTTIYCNTSLTSASSSDNMFSGNTKLIGGSGTVYDASHVNNAYARVDTAGASGYFTAKS